MSARDAALVWLDDLQLPQWPAGALKRIPDFSIEDPRDRGLAEHITTGVIKNLALLQHLTQYYAGRNVKSIDLAAQKVIAIALYQLRFLTRVPASAAVDEAVTQVRRIGLDRASGFVNAVLRNATRDPNPQLPSASTSPAEFASVVLSHPRDLFDRLAAQLGVDEALRVCEHDQTEPPLIVRTYPGVLPSRLESDGVTITPHEQPGLYVVSGATKTILARWADEGLAQVQDATSASTALSLDLQLGQSVLDRCAGRGTKTLQMQSLVGPTGKVVALDPAEARINDLKTSIARRGIQNIEPYQAATLAEAGIAGVTFDRVLVDAPCSNSGVFARRPEARYRQSRSALRSISHLQRKILDDTAPATQPGGLLVYSTCSIWQEENEAIAEAFVSRHPDYHLVRQCAVLPASQSPEQYRDGGFVAVFQRTT